LEKWAWSKDRAFFIAQMKEFLLYALVLIQPNNTVMVVDHGLMRMECEVKAQGLGGTDQGYGCIPTTLSIGLMGA